MQITWYYAVNQKRIWAVGHFLEKLRRRNMKENTDKSKMIVLGGQERSVCKVIVDGRQLEDFLEFKYLRLNVLEMYVLVGRRVAGAFRSLEIATLNAPPRKNLILNTNSILQLTWYPISPYPSFHYFIIPSM